MASLNSSQKNKDLLSGNLSLANNVMHNSELQRREIFKKLHKSYDEKFKELFFMRQAPKDSLNRFLYEQLTLNSYNSFTNNLSHIGKSTCLEKPENIKLMDTLAKEIRSSYPLISKLSTKLNIYKLKQHIDDYLKVAKIYLNNQEEQADIDNDNHDVKNLLEKFAKNYKENIYTDSNLANEFEILFNECYIFFQAKCQLRIKIICDFLYEKLKVASSELIDVSNKFENFIRCKRFPRVLISHENFGQVEVSYLDVSYHISRNCFEKLKNNYETNAIKMLQSIDNEDLFASRLFCLVCRYESFFQNRLETNENYGMQTALPSSTFSTLEELFEVSEEMFASPFNCYFSKYCSAFIDTDIYFGSHGSFFNYEPTTGSFQCNPPFTEECIERMADKIECLLSDRVKSSLPLSFIVFIPEWLEPPTPGLVKMNKSKFLRRSIVLPAHKHIYESGSKYLANVKRSPIYYASHNTKVFFLQNNSGFEKWPPNDAKIERLTQALIRDKSKFIDNEEVFIRKRHINSEYYLDRCKYSKLSK